MKYLFLYKYLHAQMSDASTNWINRTNAFEASGLFQLFQFVLPAGACTHTQSSRLARVKVRGSFLALLGAGNSRRDLGLGTGLPKGVK